MGARSSRSPISRSIFAIDAARDGKTIYFLYGNESTDIVLLKNFR